MNFLSSGIADSAPKLRELQANRSSGIAAGGRLLRYHFPVPTLPERVLATIRKQGLIQAGDRLGVAVSGGADSVALLLLLVELRSELGIALSVVHVNHQLRGEESDEDENFVAELARGRGLGLHVDTGGLAQETSGVEAAARIVRYDFFRKLAAHGWVTRIATAHTLDDQAETVLLRMLRGTGIRGLAGIHPRLVLDKGGEVVRPLLGFRRAELEAFLWEREQSWREDSSNRDLAFSRNRMRHRVLPLLKEEFGAAAVENLADLSEIARAEEEHWAAGHPEINPAGRSIAVASLAAMSLAAQRRMIRGWLQTNSSSVSFRLIEQVRELGLSVAGKKVELPGGQMVRRTQRELCIEVSGEGPVEYEYRLLVPGSVEVPELGLRVEAVLVERASVPSDQRDELLDPVRVGPELVVRNWRPGDRYWPAHTKEAKKVKELLNDRHIVGAAKERWPVGVAEDGSLVWMRGFAAPVEIAAALNARRAVWVCAIDDVEQE